MKAAEKKVGSGNRAKMAGAIEELRALVLDESVKDDVLDYDYADIKFLTPEKPKAGDGKKG